MNYIETKIYTSEVGIEMVLNALSEIGIDNAVIEDPSDVEDLMDKKNTYDWDYVDASVMEQIHEEPTVIIYSEDTEEGKNQVEQIRLAVKDLKEKKDDILEDVDLGRLVVESIVESDEEWKDNWKEYFKPSKITDRIIVKPTWEAYERKSEDELVLEIDPGMAFGTGTHETTTLCVKLLEKYTQINDAVLDVGCGSGILSIAAGLLGIKNILGIDIDPIAVEVSKENVVLNNLTDVIRIQYGDLTKGIDFKADVVVANLMADLVMMLAEDVAKHLKGKSIFISSGILIEKQGMVSEAIRKNGFEIIDVLEQGEWCAIAAQLK
ncbi:50S ribosomal protein L11 methyltransferase [Clostridium aminobutyricum]|uniref:Ribosomal protein L11 methyltransferase n=1 Tax=Clostridium aminobutyricum TaxID=33953 RepID=A0A939D7V8_CLOAM|nr:50S ribosomal protein L11 methyltransferase [Clostridium aminobutyricum]MBN7772710.1 50S ribosomal protein L11 methyltransferase [Clostridium aminobutyricum]